MNKFENITQVTSPNSVDSASQTSQSTMIKRSPQIFNSTIQPVKLQFGSGFHKTSTDNSLGYKHNLVRSQMMQTSIRSLYRGPLGLPQDRLTEIAENFLKIYGSQKQIKKNHIQKIQQEANLNNKFQQSQETVKDLFNILDENKDNRITYDDMLKCCRRYLNFEKKQIVYTPVVQERLAVARRLFKQFDVEKRGYLTQKQVPTLLQETYRTLGKNFHATQEDIKSWMKLADGDGDGYVTLPQYERSIIRALKKQGVKIYEQ